MKDWTMQQLLTSLERANETIDTAAGTLTGDHFAHLKELLEAEIAGRRAEAGAGALSQRQIDARSLRREIDRFVGIRVRNARRIVDVTQRDLAAAVGLPQSEISRIETGARSLTVSELIRFAIELRQSVCFFLEMRFAEYRTTGWERAS